MCETCNILKKEIESMESEIELKDIRIAFLEEKLIRTNKELESNLSDIRNEIDKKKIQIAILKQN